MTELRIQICDICFGPLANRIVVEHENKKLCGLQCGIEAIGRRKYLDLWTAKCLEISQKCKSKSNLMVLKIK